MNKQLVQIKNKIKEIKQQLMALEEMRPGSLTKQYRKPRLKEGAFYQISYTHKMKSKTEYVLPQFVEQLKKETEEFKKFKKLMQQWVDLAIKYSKINIQIKKNNM